MRHLKKFNTIDDYNSFLNSSEYVLPNICQVGNDEVKSNPAPSPLYVMALENLTVQFTNSIAYSLDKSTWVDLPANTATPIIPVGTKVYFKANITSPTSSAGIGTFTISGKCLVGGYPASLVYGENEYWNGNIIDYMFLNLFKGCETIYDASNVQLTAKNRKEQCFRAMFYGCTSLVYGPQLQATSLNYSCYKEMFYNCSSLIEAPELPATSLSDECYLSMFSGCKALITTPNLPAITLRKGCYSSMFYNCTSLVSAPFVIYSLSQNSCQYMFSGCSSLEKAPDILATNLGGSNSCSYMFRYCSKLNYIKAMFIDAPSTTYTRDWTSGVASTGIFVKNAAATWNVTGSAGIPSGWTVETATE